MAEGNLLRPYFVPSQLGFWSGRHADPKQDAEQPTSRTCNFDFTALIENVGLEHLIDVALPLDDDHT